MLLVVSARLSLVNAFMPIASCIASSLTSSLPHCLIGWLHCRVPPVLPRTALNNSAKAAARAAQAQSLPQSQPQAQPSEEQDNRPTSP